MLTPLFCVLVKPVRLCRIPYPKCVFVVVLCCTVVARSRKWGEEEKRRGCKYLFKGAEGNKRGKGEREREREQGGKDWRRGRKREERRKKTMGGSERESNSSQLVIVYLLPSPPPSFPHCRSPLPVLPPSRPRRDGARGQKFRQLFNYKSIFGRRSLEVGLSCRKAQNVSRKRRIPNTTEL